MKRALYPGSFNPFTKGHLDIVARGLRLFDHIVICIGVNINKPESVEKAEQTCAHLRMLFDGYPVSVVTNSGLTADMVRREEAVCVIRGVRSGMDYEYEKTMADTNMAIADVETVMLCARPELSSVSSSMVRELAHFGHDVSPYIATREDVERECSPVKKA